jgi:hypothetical protein
MKTSHTGLNISEADWNTSVKYLVATLDKFKVPEKEKTEVLNAISGLNGDICRTLALVLTAPQDSEAQAERIATTRVGADASSARRSKHGRPRPRNQPTGTAHPALGPKLMNPPK